VAETHEFELALAGQWDDLTNEMVDRLYEAGCDDGTIVYSAGHVTVGFDREAPSMLEAIASAVADLRKAGFEVERVAETDLVTQSEIARRTDKSKQYIGQLIAGHRGPGGFPPPACSTDSQKLWSWREVAGWLHRSGYGEAKTESDARDLELAILYFEHRNAAEDKRWARVADQLAKARTVGTDS